MWHFPWLIGFPALVHDPPSSRAGEGQVDPTWHCWARTRWSARCCLGRPSLALMPLWDAPLDTTRAKQTEAWIFTLGTVWQLLYESFKESSMPSATRSSCLTRQGQDSSEMETPEMPALEMWKSTSSLSSLPVSLLVMKKTTTNIYILYIIYYNICYICYILKYIYIIIYIYIVYIYMLDRGRATKRRLGHRSLLLTITAWLKSLGEVIGALSEAIFGTQFGD